MFRIESYITPIILRLVQKYVKNLKVQDTQLSLWSGEAVFSNLDLRTSSLEQDLGLPFRFVNGHIHELRISVPWHKITYEPIVITINTMECVLSLPENCKMDDVDSDSRTELSADSEPSSSSMKRSLSKQEDELSPGYIQSLVRKITNNITVVCNNLILKYVEEDIVLSLNVRTVNCCSAGENWQPEFGDYTPPLLFRRKLIRLSDLTVCLDHRNHSGKIDVYQEPILYRCSLEVRWLQQFSGLYAVQADVSWMSVFCDRFSFSVSDSQLPMVMRLAELCWAYIAGEITRDVIALSADRQGTTESDAPGEDTEADSSWTGWAWSLVPSADALFLSAEDDVTKEGKLSEHERIFHYSVHVKTMDVVLKFSTLNNRQSLPQQLKFTPYLQCSLQGVFMDSLHCGVQTSLLRAGVSHIIVNPIGNCVCNSEPHGTLSESNASYVQLGNVSESYLFGSLFSLAEVVDLRSANLVSWESHMREVSETTMLQVSPAMAMDYMFSMELPEDFTSEQLVEIEEMRSRGLPERSLIRVVFGGSSAALDCGFVHRLRFMSDAARRGKYPPYSKQVNPLSLMTPCGPSFRYHSTSLANIQVTCLEPYVCVPRKLFEHSSSQEDTVSALKMRCKSIKYTRQAPLNPLGAISVVSNLSKPSADALYNCHIHSRLAIASVEFTLGIGGIEHTVASLALPSVGCKSLCFPKLMKRNALPVDEYTFLIDCFQAEVFTAEFVELLYLFSFKSALKQDCPWRQHAMVVSIRNFQLKSCGTCRDTACSFSLGEFKAHVKLSGHDPPEPIFLTHHGFEYTSSPSTRCLLRIPRSGQGPDASPALMVQSAPMLVSWHPVLLCWTSLTSSLMSWKDHPLINYSQKQLPPFRGHEPPSTSPVTNEVVQLVTPVVKTTRSDHHASVHRSESADIPQPHSSRRSRSNRSQSSRTTSAFSFPVAANRSATKVAVNSWNVLWVKQLVMGLNLGAITFSIPSQTYNDQSSDPAGTGKLDSAGNTSNPSTLGGSLGKGRLVIVFPEVNVRGGTDGKSFASRDNPDCWQNPEKFLLVNRQANNPWSVKMTAMSVYWDKMDGSRCTVLSPTTAECTLGVSASDSCVSVVLHANTPNIELHVGLEQLNTMVSSVELATELYSLFVDNAPLGVVAMPRSNTDVPLSSNIVHGSSNLGESVRKSPQLSAPDTAAFSSGVTFWLQWTVPRLSVSLGTATSTLFQLLVEETAFSLDAQPVFLKANIGIGSLDVTRHKGGPIMSATACPLEDVVFTSSPRIRRDLKMNELQRSDESDDEFVFAGVDLLQPAQPDTKSWLSLTWTQATRSDVLKKWGRRLSTENVDDHKFISELEILLRPCDMMFTSDMLLSLSPVLQLFKKLSMPSPSSGRSAPQVISCSNLPLVYANVGTLRLFLPVEDVSSQEADDVMIMQVTDMTLQPSTEFPLSRPVLLPDLFGAAQSDGSASLPGAKVEDRQYQADISEIFIASGRWREVIAISSDPRPSVLKGYVTMGENPAVEWNNFDPSRVPTMRALIPLLDKSSFRMVLAPAIMTEAASEENSACLVAGYGVELNVNSDLNTAVSISQLSMMRRLFLDISSSINLVFKSSDISNQTQSGSFTASRSGGASNANTAIEAVRMFAHTPLIPTDSGVESDRDSRPIVGAVDGGVHRKVQGGSVCGNTVEWVPFEVLLTFRQVSCAIYHHREKSESTQTSTLVTDAAGVSTEDLSEIMQEKDGNQRQFKQVVPLLFVSVSQPHVYFNCTIPEQKLQVSVFDLAVLTCGLAPSSNGDRPSLVPDVSRFTQGLFQTRAGSPNPKTGISPSLFTFELRNFWSDNEAFEILIRRPITLKWGREKVCRIQEVHSLLVQCIENGYDNDQTATVLESASNRSPDEIPTDAISVIRRYAVNSPTIKFSCCQLSFQYELNENVPPTSRHNICVGLSSVNISGRAESLIKEQLPRLLEMKASMHGMFICSSSPSDQCPISIAGPCSITMSSVVKWEQWSMLPFVRASISSDAVLLDIGPRQLAVATAVLDKMCNSDSKEYCFEQQKSVSSVVRTQDRSFVDDLRRGTMTYVQGNQDKCLPNHVLFDKQEASMTWRYAETRCLTAVQVLPVPFIDGSEIGAQVPEDEVKRRVKCDLQYFDEVWDRFVTVCDFFPSEEQDSQIELPIPVETGKAPASAIWRIRINASSDEGSVTGNRSVNLCPTALAACVRVNSEIRPSVVPQLSVAVALGCIQARFHVQGILPINEKLEDVCSFTPDGKFPEDVVFMNLVVDGASLSCLAWSDVTRLLAEGSVNFSTLNPAFHVEVPVVEKASFKVDIVTDDRTNPPQTDITVAAGTVELRISQMSLLGLHCAMESWRSLLRGDDEKVNVPMTRYIVANNTGCPFMFGQYSTDQNIMLCSKTMNFYAWRSPRHNSLLSLSVASSNTSSPALDCKPFPIEQDSVVSRLVSLSSQNFPLLITVKSVSAIQKLVQFDGRLQVYNMTDIKIRVHVEANPFSQMFCLIPNMQSPSVLCNEAKLSVAFDQTVDSRPNFVDIDLSRKEPYVLKLSNNYYVWCAVFSQPMVSFIRQLIVVSPVFSLCSLLPCPLVIMDSPGGNMVSIDGRGTMSSLTLDPSTTHYLTLKMTSESEVSSPPLALSASQLDQCGEIQVLSEIDDFSKKVASLEKHWLPHELLEFEGMLKTAEQSDIRLHISFERRWPWLNTLLVKIHPTTMVVNLTPTVLVFRPGARHAELGYLPPYGIVASPYDEGVFYFGAIVEDSEYQSGPLQLGRHGWLYERALPSFQGVIPSQGSTRFHIFANQQMGLFCVRSCRRDGVQWLMVHPAAVVVNRTGHELPMAAIACSWPTADRPLPCTKSVPVPSTTKNSGGQPLLWWQLADGIPPEPTSISVEHRLLLDFSYCRDPPLNLSDHRGSSAVSGPSLCQPLIASYVEKDSQICVLVNSDSSPYLQVENLTDVAFLVSYEDYEIDVDEFVNGRDLHELRANECRHFAAPNQLEISFESQPPRRLVVRERDSELSAECIIHLSFGHIQYLRLNQRHLSAIVQLRGPTYVVKLQAVRGVVLSATQVRDRLERAIVCEASSTLSEEKPSGTGSTGADSDNVTESIQEQSPVELPSSAPTLSDSSREFQITAVCHQLSVVLFDDMRDINVCQEAVRVTADHVAVAVLPGSGRFVSEGPASLCRSCRLSLCLGNLQIDNQVPVDQHHHHYEVLLAARSPTNIRLKSPLIYRSPMELSSALNNLRRGALVSFGCTFDVLESSNLIRTRFVELSVQPLEVFVEDVGLNVLRSYMCSLSAVIENSDFGVSQNGVNMDVFTNALYPVSIEALSEATALSKRIYLDKIRIESLILILHIQAQLKVHLCIDGSPVHLPLLEKTFVRSNMQQLIADILHFYVWSAIYKAGVVVSSLDLLGDPGGLARSMSRGVQDLVEMPYRGLLRGPTGFVGGCASGLLSLSRHLTAGTISSLAALSTGLARNLDALSLDAEYAEHAELKRRAGSTGLLSGVSQGLTGLGMSLLGAVAGLANQPLQGALTSGTASAVVGGIGRGLVGVVAKPLGGAVDLVAHTGRGILHSAGWRRRFQRRVQESYRSIADHRPALLWFVTHFGVNGGSILSVFEAVRVTEEQKYGNVLLMLTSKELCVLVSNPGGSAKDFISSHSLSKTELIACASDSDRLMLVTAPELSPRVSSPSGSAELCSNDDYVMEYLRHSSSHSDGSKSSSPIQLAGQISSPIFSLLVSASVKATLLSQFRLARDRLHVCGPAGHST